MRFPSPVPFCICANFLFLGLFSVCFLRVRKGKGKESEVGGGPVDFLTLVADFLGAYGSGLRGVMSAFFECVESGPFSAFFSPGSLAWGPVGLSLFAKSVAPPSGPSRGILVEGEFFFFLSETCLELFSFLFAPRNGGSYSRRGSKV